MRFSFTVPGAPVPKGRARVAIMKKCSACGRFTVRAVCICGNDTFGKMFSTESTPKETVIYENQVRMFAAEAMRQAGINEPLAGPLQVMVNAYFSIPDSRKCGPRCKGAGVCKRVHPGDPHENKPDADNILKSVLDGCNTVVWRDDSQAFDVHAVCWWGSTPGLSVSVDAYARPSAQPPLNLEVQHV